MVFIYMHTNIFQFHIGRASMFMSRDFNEVSPPVEPKRSSTLSGDEWNRGLRAISELTRRRHGTVRCVNWPTVVMCTHLFSDICSTV